MKKNILISVYDMEIGGIERSLINMLESFDYEKYNVDLLVFSHNGEFMSLIPEQVNLLPPIPSYSVFRRPILECIKEGHFFTSFARICSKLVAKRKAKDRVLEEGAVYIQMQLAIKYSTYFLPKIKKRYEVAISYAWPHDILAKKVKANKKIAWIHTDYSRLEVDYEIDFNMWNKFDFIVSISDECTNSFLRTYPKLKEKIIKIENITAPSFIKRMMSETVENIDDNDKTFQILSIGRLSYAKGFDLAIKALRKLHENGLTNIKWYVIGYGPEEKNLRELIKECKLENHFVLLGKKNNPYPYIKACDLYVQPSRYEGKAVTVTEAKIVGKPILITNYPTSKSQIINGEEGFICELSVDGLQEGIKKIVEDEELRQSLVSRLMEKDYRNNYELKNLYKLMS